MSDKVLHSYLRGAWVVREPPMSVLQNPTDGEAIASVGTTGGDLPSALRFARDEGGPRLREMTFEARGRLLRAMSQAIFEARDTLIDTSIRSTGTTRSDAKFDIDGASATLAHYADLGEKLGSTKLRVDGPGALLGRGSRFWGIHVWASRPGVALQINAFNFPVWGIAEKAACALLAGMPVVSKPATAGAWLAVEAFERMLAAGPPEGALTLVLGSVSVLLEALGGHDVLAFTGSSHTAAQLRALPAFTAGSARINVEADSLNASVLGPDVDPGDDLYDMFLRDVVKEITQKTGQKCTATRRIFVPGHRLERVRDDLCERLAQVRVGNPSQRDVTMGPLATARQRESFRAGIAQLSADGARRVFGDPHACEVLGADAERGFFVGPVLLLADEPERANAVHRVEVFGPCATLMPYRSAEEAVRLVALGGGGLVASAYSDDRDHLEQLLFGLAPHHGRVLMASRKIVDQTTPPGLVLPSCTHGGPGRAGGGEELGGERGLNLYMQRCAIQGDRARLARMLPFEEALKT